MDEQKCKLHEYRLGELSEDIKDMKSDIKTLNEKVDCKFDTMTEVLIKSQADMFDRLIENNKLKLEEKKVKSNNKTNIVTAIPAGAISLIISVISKVF